MTRESVDEPPWRVDDKFGGIPSGLVRASGFGPRDTNIDWVFGDGEGPGSQAWRKYMRGEIDDATLHKILGRLDWKPDAHWIEDFDLLDFPIDDIWFKPCPRNEEPLCAKRSVGGASSSVLGILMWLEYHATLARLRSSGTQSDMWRWAYRVRSHEMLQAAATVAIFSANDTVKEPDGSLKLPGITVRDSISGSKECGERALCKELSDGFSNLLDNPAGARCTGVLVASNVVATARHCANTLAWHNMRFVFGFQKSGGERSPSSHHYSGRPVVCNKDEDWALVRLNADVPADVAIPVEIQSKSTIQPTTQPSTRAFTPAYSFGHAFGSTRLRSGQGGERASYIRTCPDGEITSSLDRFHSSSGAPVFGYDDTALLGLLRVDSGGSHFITDPCCTPRKGSYFRPSCVDEVIPTTDFEGHISEAVKADPNDTTIPDSCNNGPSSEAASPPSDPP